MTLCMMFPSLQFMAALQPSRVLSQTLVMTNTYNRAAHLQPSLAFLLRLFVARKLPTTEEPADWARFLVEGNAITGMQDTSKTFNGGQTPFEVRAGHRAFV